MTEPAYGLHWFRRDLRLVGNPALERNLARHPGRVLGVFCFDRKFLARPDFSVNRFAFFLRTLETLRAEMRAQGGELLVLGDAPDEAFDRLLGDLKESPLGLPACVSWNRDYEPFAVERDQRLTRLFERKWERATLTERDHLLIEPDELSKDGKTGAAGAYQVFTPFSRKWKTILGSTELNARLRETGKWLKSGAPELSLVYPHGIAKNDVFEAMLASTLKRCTVALPKAGHAAAKELLRKFRDRTLADYAEKRDLPGVSGTSKMSVYLKNGSITTAQIVALLKLGPEAEGGAEKYLNELIWREFYVHVLAHFPHVEREPFQRRYARLAWENNEQWFRAWCRGETGFPIVDAGMRQLNETGWMHNRVRMIVASFLTKDLLIDYRWGERYFMEKLLDGDLAPNNGGWQWASSTGCDPQPYFRIFNPASQALKFDPDGTYVRHWAPNSPTPIVDHATQREKALALFKRTRG